MVAQMIQVKIEFILIWVLQFQLYTSYFVHTHNSVLQLKVHTVGEENIALGASHHKTAWVGDAHSHKPEVLGRHQPNMVYDGIVRPGLINSFVIDAFTLKEWLQVNCFEWPQSYLNKIIVFGD